MRHEGANELHLLSVFNIDSKLFKPFFPLLQSMFKMQHHFSYHSLIFSLPAPIPSDPWSFPIKLSVLVFCIFLAFKRQSILAFSYIHFFLILNLPPQLTVDLCLSLGYLDSKKQICLMLSKEKQVFQILTKRKCQKVIDSLADWLALSVLYGFSSPPSARLSILCDAHWFEKPEVLHVLLVCCVHGSSYLWPQERTLKLSGMESQHFTMVRSHGLGWLVTASNVNCFQLLCISSQI